MIDLLLERTAPDILDYLLDEVAFRPTHPKANKVTIREFNFKVVATGGNNILRSCSFVTGERPKSGRDRAFVELCLRQHAGAPRCQDGK